MPAAERQRRWFHLSPDRFVLSLLLVICLLWLSDRSQWFGFNHHKGWTVLIAVAAVVMDAIVMLLWWIVSLIFGGRFQFGIRSLLAFCLASSIAAGWLAVEMKRARRQAEVVQWINSVGGAVYDWQLDAVGRLRLAGFSEPPQPRWLRTMLGNDFFSTVVRVTCKGTTITDTGFAHLKGLIQLRELRLMDTKITDAGLEHLKGLTQLQGLDLVRTKITNAGLEYLEGLNKLESLDLYGSKITDAGLEHLKGLPQLGVLGLMDTNITDAGLEHLKGLTQLECLSLVGTKTTDGGVKELQHSLPNCKIYH